MTVYGLMSDLHVHNWSSFASIDEEGRNTRLMHIIREVHRCCAELRARGGRNVVIAGDVFHTRGSVSPSVFNPLRDALEDEENNGMVFHIIPGNHDLEGRTSNRLSSAVEMLGGLENVWTAHDPTIWSYCDEQTVAVIPWEPDLKTLLVKAKKLAEECDPSNADLIIHAGIDGVLSGMPDHGLTADMLADLGFKRVFAGHYHNHRDMGQGVYSIGAPTHQTWSDVGTRAGWLIVDPKRVQFFASHAPNFLDLTGEEDQDELPLIVDGHFVRARCKDASPTEVNALREALMEMGAKGVLVQSVPTSTAGLRVSGLSSVSLGSLDRAIADYCTARGLPSEVIQSCDTLLREVRT